VGICRKRAAVFPLLSFRNSPFLHPVFAIITGIIKHLFTEPPSIIGALALSESTILKMSGHVKKPLKLGALCRKVGSWHVVFVNTHGVEVEAAGGILR
jgi:hypothetical protein